jgi:NAD(P)-dependent dehydrogenase (short-subunit alcohol dehydrogenase family)
MVRKLRWAGYGLAALGLGVGTTAAARRLRWFPLAGRVVLVSGSSRGLGLLVAREAGRQGARIVICARSEADLSRAAQELEAEGIEVLALACDLRNPDDIQRLVATAEKRFGGVDVLVHVAGVIQVGPAEEMTLEDYREAMDIHYWAAVHLVRAVVPGMRSRGGGRIALVTSVGGRIAVPHLLPYVASKFALAGFSEGLRAELASSGILVTTVAPGLMRTGSAARAAFKGKHRLEYTWFALMDSLPGLSMDAERAAQRILAATVRGQADLVLTLPATVAARVHGVFPGLTAQLLGLVNRALPGPGGVGEAKMAGAESETWLTRSFLTALSRRAGREANQVPGRTDAEGVRALRLAQTNTASTASRGGSAPRR